MRPEQPHCNLYLRFRRCSFGRACRFHHPELVPPAWPGPDSALMPPTSAAGQEMTLQASQEHPVDAAMLLSPASLPVSAAAAAAQLKGGRQPRRQYSVAFMLDIRLQALPDVNTLHKLRTELGKCEELAALLA